MLPFQTGPGAAFTCEADLWGDPYFALNFHDGDCIGIPFHLSLRRLEGIVVVNRQDRAGWRREVATPWVFDDPRVRIDMRFSRGQVAVTLGGVALGRFDRFPRPAGKGRFFMRRGFPDLGRIGHVSWVGALVPDSLVLENPSRPVSGQGTGLTVTDRLEAVWAGLDHDAALALEQAGMVLQVDGLETDLAMTCTPLPYRRPGGEGAREHALRAVLPGRIWAEGADRVALRLVDAAGRVHRQAQIGRDGLRRMVEQLGAHARLRHDALAALQMLEHVRHAGLLPQLSPKVRAAVMERADFYGLGDWMAGDAAPSPLPDRPGATAPGKAGSTGMVPAVAAAEAPPHPEAEDSALVHRQLDRFTAAMRAAPAQDAAVHLAALLETAALGPRREGMLLATLTEWFAVHDDPRRLFRLASRRGHRFAVQYPDDVWHLSSLLPFLYLQGQFDDLAQVLHRLVRLNNSWLVMQTLSWVAQQAAFVAPDAAGQVPTQGQRVALLEGWYGILESRGRDYWARLPCQRMIAASVTILSAGTALPGGLAARLQGQVLRHYALTPSFWQAVEKALPASEMPLAVAEAHGAFQRLMGAVSHAGAMPPADAALRARIARLLVPFDRLGCVDAPRFRRDLLGPLQTAESPLDGAEVPAFRAADLPDMTAQQAADEAQLRWLAHPQGAGASGQATAPDGQGEALTRVAARGIAAAWHAVPHDDTLPHLTALAGHALALARASQPAQEAVQALIDEAGHHAVKKRDFVGLTVLLRLATVFLHRGDAAVARRLLVAALTLRGAAPASESADLFAEPGPGLALGALARAPGGADMLAAAGAAPPNLSVIDATPDGTDPPHPPRRPPAGYLFDTLVCVYTCRANLESRVQMLRQTWLRDLSSLGVEFLVFVGDGDGRREGDVVHLQAPDDYEGLPQKTLAMVRWVLVNTDHDYLLKIDDDCFLDAETLFLSLSPLRHDYWGRRLFRGPGQTSRDWHMAKARTPRGRMELDKSPEPSTYADGGSGYLLSRRAMATLCAVAQTGQARALIGQSFMEDKLVGDLLALGGIGLTHGDYRIALMRRSRPGGPVVSQWENGFLPFRGGGISMAHLDGTERMAALWASRQAPAPSLPALRPSKVWPSYQRLKLGYASNALDLLSSPDRLARVCAAPVAVIACLRNESFMLPHFLDHYRALGAEGFLIADNGSDDATLDILAEAPDVALFSVDTDYGRSQYGVAWQQALLANFRTGRWSLVADADELLVAGPDWQVGGLPALVAGADFAQADAARVFMLDMYPQGPLSTATFDNAAPFAQAGYCDAAPFLDISGTLGPFTNAPAFTSALRHRLIPGSRAELFMAQKYALLRYQPWMRLSAGLHFMAEARTAPRDLIFAHFKYNAAFRAKAVEEVARRQHFNDAEEYRKYLALASEGRETVFDPALSVPWRDCDFVRRILPGGMV